MKKTLVVTTEKGTEEIMKVEEFMKEAEKETATKMEMKILEIVTEMVVKILKLV